VWWGENLGAPWIGFPQDFAAPDLSRAVDDPPHRVSKLARPTTRWAMQRARVVQIRRDYDIGGSDRHRRRDLRPTACCVQEHAPA